MTSVKMLLFGAVILTAVLAMVALLRYMTVVPGRPHSGPLPALTAEEESLARRLAAHIAAIASRPHNIRHYDELEQAARYIERELVALGYAPSAQVFNVDGRDVRNIEAVIEPADPARLRGTVVVGAHYDSFGDAPGANDNGSGTAAILELARMLGDLRGRTDVRIHLVLFVNEEPRTWAATVTRALSPNEEKGSSE
jgi:acetylornithine deacetylase/succinyl-diaminopimelate desuccinylase-like protein